MLGHETIDRVLATLVVSFASWAAAHAPALAIEHDVVLSLYQGECQEGDFDANLTTVRTVVGQAKQRGSHFIVFPEAFLSGYASREDVQRGARALNDPALVDFIAESSEHNMVILVGLARKTAAGLYNTVLVIHHGKLLGFYDKIMLTGGDRHPLGFLPGKAVPVFRAHGVNFAAIICHDSSFPHVALSARLQGAELLFTPHNNQIAEAGLADHMRWVRNCHVGLACQLKMVVARSNIVKNDRPGRSGYGGSFVLSPQGEPLVEAELYKTELITTTITPAMFRGPHVWADLNEVPAWLNEQLAELINNHRPPADEPSLQIWLENMIVHHRFTPGEVSAATGLTLNEVRAAGERFKLQGKTPSLRSDGDPLRVLPYPGGRHPRIGFLDGAVAPQRETKLSIFTPWDDSSYVVADLPEAIWSNLGLTYLAHTHVPTIWSRDGIQLPRQEWERHEDGSFYFERTLPNGIRFGTRVQPAADAVRLVMWLHNGTDAPLSDLRVQNCVMLKAARGFSARSSDNKVLQPPYAACRSEDGRRWIVMACAPLHRAWANAPVPCLHSDPKFPDCAPGETVHVRGWLSFYEGDDVQAEFQRIEQLGWQTAESWPQR